MYTVWKRGNAEPWEDKCSPVLAEAQTIIDSSKFHAKLDKLISTTKSKLNTWGTIYYVGYAQFFREEDNQCDSITWSFWYETGWRQYLTLDRRRTMNSLVRNMNLAISAAVRRAASNEVVFVDFDKYYQSSVARFCEKGEPETNSNREGLLLYNYYTDDNVEPGTLDALDKPLPRSRGWVMNGTSEGQLNDWVRETAASKSSLKPVYPQGKVPEKTIALMDVKAIHDQIYRGYSSNFLPDSYGRIFHPRPAGHPLIANLIIYYMSVIKSKKLKPAIPPEQVIFNQCPAQHAAPASKSRPLTPTSTKSAPPTRMTTAHPTTIPLAVLEAEANQHKSLTI